MTSETLKNKQHEKNRNSTKSFTKWKTFRFR